MKSSTDSTGNLPRLGENRPYVLCVTSHKGGTGRTTLACGLAYLWGKRGLKVTLVDADPVKAACVLAAGRSGVCPWDNVNLVASRGGTTRIPPGQDVVLIDTPPATEPLAQKVLVKADGVVVVTLADSLALATLPMATKAVLEARETNPDLDVLGIVVNIFNAADLAQTRAVSQLRGAKGGLFLEPAVPYRPELRAWALTPGGDLPPGPGQQAIKQLADTFRETIADAGWEQFATARREASNYAYAAGR